MYFLAPASGLNQFQLYFVSNSNSPYYQSTVFDHLLDYVATHARRCNLRETNGKRSLVIKQVESVKNAVEILRAIIKVDILAGEGEEDTEPLFRAIQDIDFVKYHVYPKGYMIRSSSDSHREQVRVSKEAASRGITFEQVGNSYIRQYKQNPNIKAVKLIFVTADDANFAEMRADAKKTRDITLTLSKILEGMATDCRTCNLKEICDEVEGLKELHFGQSKK